VGVFSAREVWDTSGPPVTGGLCTLSLPPLRLILPVETVFCIGTRLFPPTCIFFCRGYKQVFFSFSPLSFDFSPRHGSDTRKPSPAEWLRKRVPHGLERGCIVMPNHLGPLFSPQGENPSGVLYSSVVGHFGIALSAGLACPVSFVGLSPLFPLFRYNTLGFFSFLGAPLTFSPHRFSKNGTRFF